MKKILNSVVIMMLLVLSLTACSKGESKTTTKTVDPDCLVWTTNGLEKIMRDDVYEREFSNLLSIELSQNEVEGGQIIITPRNSYKVNSFTITVEDLKDSNGNVISKDNIDIYLEKYIEVKNKMSYNVDSHAGFFPDAILPFDKAVEYNENTVNGVNQGIYITITTTKDTVPGLYSGKCNLVIDGKDFVVPMSVKVYNFAISDETHSQSLFAIWQQDLIYGELDGSNEMYAAYYEFLAEHRISASNPLSSYWGQFKLEDYIEEAKRISKDPRVSTYAIPQMNSTTQTMDYGYLKSFILGVVRESEKNAEILDKAVYYFGAYIDEPEYTHTYALAHRIFNEINAMEEEVISELESTGFFDDKSDEETAIIKEKIRKIPNILTASYTNTANNPEGVVFEFGECTYCPLFNEYDGYNDAAKMDNLTLYQKLKEVNGSVWWYGCNGPCYPYPCYHIDDSLIGARILGTMMYNYKVDGNLYWEVNAYSQSNTIGYGDIVRSANPYDDAARNCPSWPTNGEGFLLYPGVDYGIFGPVGSLRLEAIRDGNEDYEYYYLLNTLTSKLSEYYQDEISTDDMVQSLYDRLYSGCKYINNYNNFFDVRSELASTIERCNENNKMVVKKLSYSKEYATIEFYVASGYDVSVNNEAIDGVKQGNGYKYTYTIKMDQETNKFDIYISGNETSEVIINAGGKTKIISEFNNEENISLLSGNDESIVITYNAQSSYAHDEGSAKVEITSIFDPNDTNKTIAYAPRVSVNLKEAGIDINKLSSVMLNIYNGSEIDVPMIVRLSAKGFHFDVKTYTLNKGWNTIVIDGINLLGWQNLSSADKLVFEFYNTVNGQNMEAMPKQTLYFDDLIISEIGGN